MYKYLLLSLAVASVLFACEKAPEYPVEPIIKFERINRAAIYQNPGHSGAPADTLAIVISFTDGDGDIGNEDASIDVFRTDSRDGSQEIFKLPFVPKVGDAGGISGEITLKTPNTFICCVDLPNEIACEPWLADQDMYYTLQIMDRNGHLSNEVDTEVFMVRCAY